MQTAVISTAPEDYLTSEELAQARGLYERLCIRIRRTISGKLAQGGAGAANHLRAVRDRVTASRRSATADDAQVFELVREWKNIAALADREASWPAQPSARLMELAQQMATGYEAARIAARAATREDELLHTDDAGDRLYAAPPRGRRGTMLFIRPGEGETYLPTPAVDALRAALKGEGPTGAARAQLLNEAAEIASSKQHTDHTTEDCTACSMAAVIAYELRCMADAALASDA
ncbi:hypothetical protein ACEZCY_14030 [Streptacidiphilus sp. N1-12]|uniref:Uncharacterized protein n=2 Tax=Streptacidiphilus alkalitolerans TaxID=3342712 RepID=A0ABV6V9P9_9ACTN